MEEEKEKPKMVPVVATARGFDNTQIREEGEEFFMPEGVKGSWFKPRDVPEEKKPLFGKNKKDDIA